jgi:AraC family transcriptional regulator
MGSEHASPEVGAQTPEFGPMLRGPALRTGSSRSLTWRGFVVEKLVVEPFARPEAISDRYIVALWSAATVGEHINEHGLYTAYTKPPGALTVIAPGIVPAVRPKNRCEIVACSLDPAFMNGVEAELDHRSADGGFYQTGLHDHVLSQLMALLHAEVERDGVLGRLYADHLAHALAVRLLLLDRVDDQMGRKSTSPLPRPALRRVLDRMHDVSSDVDLEALAAESGYSRRHFLRMFRSATGCTPHKYLMRLRLQRASDLIRRGRASLTDIALDCGFSSHSHMSSVFRELLGVTPSDYRRKR